MIFIYKYKRKKNYKRLFLIQLNFQIHYICYNFLIKLNASDYEGDFYFSRTIIDNDKLLIG
jgi:hypothetical protein